MTRDGIEGDRRRHRRYRGGPDRVVSLFSLERIRSLQAEGYLIAPGMTDENITISGLEWVS